MKRLLYWGMVGIVLCSIIMVTDTVQAKKWRIGAIEKTLINEHWQFMKQGYEDAAKRLGVEVVVGSVPTEADTELQLNLLETMIAAGYDAFSISPITGVNLIPALIKATKMGIPIINVDEQINPKAAKEAGVKVVTYIASNNYHAGEIAAQYLIDHLKPGDKVACIEGMAGTTSSRLRSSGFGDTIKKDGILNLVVSLPADWDRAMAMNVMSDLLTAHPDLKGVYACNDTMALGIVSAVEAAGKQGQILILGNDAVPEAKLAVKEGRMIGTIAQYPYEMGWLGVEAAIKVLEGRPVADFIPSPIKLLLKEDIK